MPPKKKEYVKFGSTKFRIPAKMVGIDSKDKPHLYKTITPTKRLSVHNKKPAIDLTVNNNTKTKINRVPRTTQRISFVEKKKPRKPRQPRIAPIAQIAPPPPPPPPFNPPRPPAPRPPPPPAPRPEPPPYQPPPRPPPNIQRPPLPVRAVPQPWIVIQQPPPPPPPPIITQEQKEKLGSSISGALKARLARRELENLRRKEQAQVRIANLFGKISTNFAEADRQNVKLDIAKGQAQKLLYKLELSPKQREAASNVSRVIKGRIERKKVAKIRATNVVNAALKEFGDPLNTLSGTIRSSEEARMAFLDPYAPIRKSQIRDIEIKQQEYKDSLNRNIIRKKRKEAAMSINAAIRRRLVKDIIKENLEPIVDVKKQMAANKIISLFRSNLKRKKTAKNKKLQDELLLKEPSNLSSSPVLSEKEAILELKKWFANEKKRVAKEEDWYDKEDKKMLVKSFKTKREKEIYLKEETVDLETYKEQHLYPLYDEIQKLKSKPESFWTLKELFDKQLSYIHWERHIKRIKERIAVAKKAKVET